MKALLIIAQGSRRQDSNDEVRRLADRIRENTGPSFGQVMSAFLEATSPIMDSAVADLIEEGATTIVVFPYFLTAGNHVFSDIPRIIKEEKERYPQVEFIVLPHFGALQGTSSLILNYIYNSPYR